MIETKLRFDDILLATAQMYGVSVAELVGPSRRGSKVEPRQVAMWLARQLTKLSLAEIGEALNRDHTTVLHGLRTIERRRKTEPMLDGAVALLMKELTNDGKDGPQE